MHIDKTLIIPQLAMFMLAATALSTQSLAVGGDVLLPGLSTAAPGIAVLCFNNSTGQLGPCAAGIVVSPPCIDPNNRFKDCGDGTVYDKQTGLMWEKKLASGDAACLDPTQANRNVRCQQNKYTWTEYDADPTGILPTGTLYSDFLEKLNDLKTPNDGTATPCFAGYCDWRIPTISELRSILLAPVPGCPVNPCIDAIFGPTQLSVYWSSSSLASYPVYVWFVGFVIGNVGFGSKGSGEPARAVRSGR
jgi:hypothetical protein